MKRASFMLRLHVIFLALLLNLLFSGCTSLKYYPSETCNSQAYVQSILLDHITGRYGSGAPVRLAVIPFSTPANLSRFTDQRPGLNNLLAWQVQAGLLKTGELPIVEVLNRQDWPGKKDEFFTGNHGALAQARAAGYDIILIGLLEPSRDVSELTAYTKVIEVESGITLWYGRSNTQSYKNSANKILSNLYLTKRHPNQMDYMDDLVSKLSECIVSAVMSEQLEADMDQSPIISIGSRSW